MTRLLLLGVLLATSAHAQVPQFPAKPVRVMVGYAAGSSTDIVGRVMADRLGAYWKQSVIIENRGGAAGNLAADAVAKAPGDGYTLLFAQNGLAISAAALPNLPYKAETDLTPLAPGSGADIAGRIVAKHLGDAWKQPVLVENRPGAGGQISTYRGIVKQAAIQPQ